MNWRIYLVGAGAIAHQHAIASQRLGDVQLFAADPSEQARAEFSAAFPDASVFDSAEKMLLSQSSEEQDIVVLAVPPWLHCEAGLLAFKTERHVLCEKPVVRSISELEQLISASRQANKLLGDCSVRFLVGDALAHARSLVNGGLVGDPYHARLVNRRPRSRPGVEFQPNSGWFLDKAKSGGGAIFDWGVYDLTAFFDVLRPVRARVTSAWLATPKTEIDPKDVEISVETHAGATMQLELENGATVAFDYERGNGLHGEPQSILCLDGSEGGLRWDWTPPFENDAPHVTRFFDKDGKLESESKSFESFGWEEVHACPLLEFAKAVNGEENVILPIDRLRFNFSVMAAIYECATSGAPVDVKLGD